MPSFSQLRLDSTGQDALNLTSFLLSFFLSLSPPLFFFISLLLTLSQPLLPYGPPICLSLSLALSFVLSDHHWHQSNASLHLQPGPWAHGPWCEAGRLLPGEGGVWGGETWRTQAQGPESPCLPAFPDQIHRCRYGWVTCSRHLRISFNASLTSDKHPH